jgi:ABC-2 type transport system permease protein
VLAVALCFVFAVASYPIVTDFLSRNLPALAEVARGISIDDRFQPFVRGVIALPDLVYFVSFMGFFLFLNVVILQQKKAD